MTTPAATGTPTGNAWSNWGGFIANVGNTVGSVAGIIKGGQNASSQPTAAQTTAAAQSNMKLILIIGGGLLALVIGGLLFFRSGK